MSTPLGPFTLETLGALRLHGADVVPFLQGQLSNDIALLAPGRSLLAGYHNPQGRVIALLRLVQIAPTEVLAIMPRELSTVVASRLAKFILRSKVRIVDDSAAWSFSGLVGAADAAELPRALNGAARLDGSIAVCVGAEPARWLLVSPLDAGSVAPGGAARAAPAAGAAPAVPAAPAAEDAWRRLSVAAGEPEVFAATSEEFVGQMLNLDLVGAIAFDKGCYTGQEVIARAHYRGRIKRRLQRFVTLAPARLDPGDAGELPDGRAFKVVSAAPHADGRCEFLAVAPLTGGDLEAHTAAREAPGKARTIEARPLPLPYALPE